MQKLRVGFDVDGVMLSPYELCLDEIGKMIGRKPSLEEVVGYSFEEIFNISGSDVKEMFDRVLSRSRLPAMPGIDFFIRLLPVLEKPIYFITSRPRRIADETVLQLNEHLNGFCEFKVVHARTAVDRRVSKAVLVNALGLDYFVEDEPRQVDEIRTYAAVLVLLMDMPWNRDLNIPGIVRCGDWRKGNQWEHIYDFLIRRARNGLGKEAA